MMVPWQQLLSGTLAALLFSVVGVVFFAAVFWIIDKAAPFSIRKEIEEDQNTALGIVIGSILLGMAIIIAAAIHG